MVRTASVSDIVEMGHGHVRAHTTHTHTHTHTQEIMAPLYLPQPWLSSSLTPVYQDVWLFFFFKKQSLGFKNCILWYRAITSTQLYNTLIFTFEKEPRSWRDGSAVKSTDRSSRGPEFNSQHPHGGPQPSVIGCSLLRYLKRTIVY